MEQGEITIELPANVHLLINLAPSGVARGKDGWTCLLCDKKADSAIALVARSCPAPRIYRITAL